MKWLGKQIILPTVFVSLISLLSCSTEKPESAENTAQPAAGGFFSHTTKQTISVVAFTVIARELPWVITATGKAEASNRFQAKAPANTDVQKVLVEEGQPIQAGDPLVKFNQEELKKKIAKDRAEVKEGEAGAENFGYMLKNKEPLLQENKISEVEAEGLDERVKFYEAQAERARTEIEYYEGLNELEQINSPISGLVVKNTVTDGAKVTEGEVMLEIIQIDPINFVFTLPVEAASAIEKGAAINVKFGAVQGREFAGEVINVGAESNAETHGLEVKLKIPNLDKALKGEMRGEVVLHTPLKKKVFPIPETALLRSEKSQYVFKIDQNKLKKVPVEIGESLNGQISVEKGLNDGDKIVLTVDDKLKDGATVEIQGAPK
ncbi:MAG: efflux RND transporter periplasmic adaptor subunit [Deltaproteobacteria bacterium]|nr:efflux RND transporter periplasmic adaptor subunit [Deltaproteobacteria bacterium]